MKAILTCLLILVAGLCYGQRYHFTPKYSTVLDSIKGKLLLMQCSRSVPDNINGYWKISAKDIQILELNFKKLSSQLSSSCCFPNTKIKKLNSFVFQYRGVVIAKKRYIYINAFHIYSDEDLKTRYKNWKTDAISACDGGTYFWGALFDTNNCYFSNLAINGAG